MSVFRTKTMLMGHWVWKLSVGGLEEFVWFLFVITEKTHLSCLHYFVYEVKVHCGLIDEVSDRKWWTWWAPQEYIKSQWKDMIRPKFTAGEANPMIRCESRDVASIAFIILSCKVENIELFSRMTLCSNSQSALRFSWRHWHPDSMKISNDCHQWV